MLYFAYGSNLHPGRLGRRVPSCEALEPATLSAYELTFTKRGTDGSGKCALVPTREGSGCVHGVLYRIAPHDRPSLDRAEGVHVGGYLPVDVTVSCSDQRQREAFTYVPPARQLDGTLQPYDWYKAFVVRGARFHRLPAPWIERLEAVGAIEDPLAHRAALNAQILATLR